MVFNKIHVIRTKKITLAFSTSVKENDIEYFIYTIFNYK